MKRLYFIQYFKEEVVLTSEIILSVASVIILKSLRNPSNLPIEDTFNVIIDRPIKSLKFSE